METLNDAALKVLFNEKLYLIEEKLRPVVVLDQKYEAESAELLFIDRLVNYLGHGLGYEEVISSASVKELADQYSSVPLVLCFIPNEPQVSEFRPGFVVCPSATLMHQNIPMKKELQKRIDPFRRK